MTALPDRLIVVTDRHQAGRSLEGRVEEATKAGARWIWLRDRDLDIAARRDLALRLRRITRASGAALSIGDDVGLALEVGAQGVHLRHLNDVPRARACLPPTALMGLSAHSVAEVDEAVQAGLSYVTFSPIFPTPSKPGYGPALGLEKLAEAATRPVAVYALGGITRERVAACRLAGAAGVAVMGGAMRAPSTALYVRELHRELE